MKRVVIPGELVSDQRKRLGGNVFVSNGRIYSKVLGITEENDEKASVIPLEGKYFPQSEDVVIGVVSRVVFAGYGVNINSFTESFIPKSAMRDDLRVGDLVSSKISYVNELREAELSFPRKMFGGEVIEVTPVRTPRLIGKNGSMLELLKQGTGCEIVVGKNGRVWARNGNTALLRKVVKFVNDNSYKSNLTNSVEEFFKEEGIQINIPKKGETKPVFAEESEVLESNSEESEVIEEKEELN
jgi:exosome complex component RRP4